MNVMDLRFFKRIEETQGKKKKTHKMHTIGQLTCEYFKC